MCNKITDLTKWHSKYFKETLTQNLSVIFFGAFELKRRKISNF
jgi:hypothetical protein